MGSWSPQSRSVGAVIEGRRADRSSCGPAIKGPPGIGQEIIGAPIGSAEVRDRDAARGGGENQAVDQRGGRERQPDRDQAAHGLRDDVDRFGDVPQCQADEVVDPVHVGVGWLVSQSRPRQQDPFRSEAAGDGFPERGAAPGSGQEEDFGGAGRHESGAEIVPRACAPFSVRVEDGRVDKLQCRASLAGVTLPVASLAGPYLVCRARVESRRRAGRSGWCVQHGCATDRAQDPSGSRDPFTADMLPQTTAMAESVRQFIIQGITSSGSKFRPSDWAERLAGVMSPFRPKGSVASPFTYSPYVVPTFIDGVKCVVVDERLRALEPWPGSS